MFYTDYRNEKCCKMFYAISSLTFRGAILYNLDKIANCDRAIDVDIRLKTRPENFSCRV